MADRTVLLVAFHFPPIRGSSGIQRTLRFAQHLPKFGWRPIVLTISPRAYESTAAAAGNEVPQGLQVERAFGFDTARQLSLLGRYPRMLAMPDRWTTWRHWAVPLGRKLVLREKVDAVWSTFPIPTAHEIGLEIAQRCGLPWIAEFRDPMWQGEEYPADPVVNRAWQSMERRIFARADRIVVTTPGAAELYAARFPDYPPSQIRLVENGYDEEVFARASATENAEDATVADTQRPLTLVHSGIVYPSERDPTHFFRALARLKARGAVSAATLQVVLRATANDELLGRELDALGLRDLVRLEPSVDYLVALREMLAADGLLLLQAANCNAQIPAKLYEYLRAGRPILALTDPAGDTARTLNAAGAGLIARLDSADEIERALIIFIDQIRSGTWRRAPAERVASYSREAQTALLARVLDEIQTSDQEHVDAKSS